MKELSPNSQLADPKSAKKSRTYPQKHKSPSKTRTFVSTWKETGKPSSSDTATSSDFTLEKKIKQEQFQQQLQHVAPVNPLEALLEDDILITPETLMQPTVQLTTKQPITPELDSEPTKESKPTNILELLAKKDNLKKISQSVEQFQQPTVPQMSTVPTMTPPTTPQKRVPKPNHSTPTVGTKNTSPPRAPSPPTKQPAASKQPNRTISPSKNPNTSTSSTGSTANNNSGTTNTSELRFAGPAFHNSPAPSELPIPVDFFSGKNRDASGTGVKMPTNSSNVTLITGSHSSPTRDIPAPMLPNIDDANSVKVNFSKLPEFQPHSFPFPMIPPMAPPMVVGSWPLPQMIPVHMMIPQQPPVLDQMSSQLKMMLNIAS